MPRITGRGIMLNLVLTVIEALVLTYWLNFWVSVSFTTPEGEYAIGFLFIGLFIVNVIAAISNRPGPG